MNFCGSLIIAELCSLKSQDIEKILKFFSFLNDLLQDNFQNSVLKGFIASLIDILCSNFVKFGRWEISEIVGCLPDKETKFRLDLQLSRLRRLRSKSVVRSPRQRTQSTPDFIQIGSLSAEL